MKFIYILILIRYLINLKFHLIFMTSKIFVEKCCKLSGVLNILTICFGIAYFIVPVHSILLDIFGLILLASWFVNIFIISLDDRNLVKHSAKGRSINRFLFYYLVFFLLGLVLMILSLSLSNFLLIGENTEIISFFVYFCTLTGLLGIATLGFLLTLITHLNLDKKEVFNFE